MCALVCVLAHCSKYRCCCIVKCTLCLECVWSSRCVKKKATVICLSESPDRETVVLLCETTGKENKET